MMNILLIPVYQPGPKTIDFFQQLNQAFIGKLVLVDDGSGPAYEETFKEMQAGFLDSVFLSYPINRGKGSALKTGMRWIQKHGGADSYIVTADGDGQHAIEDIQKMFDIGSKLVENQLLLGVRTFDKATTPFKSYWGNRITSLFYQLSTGIKLGDTQTGLRGFDHGSIERLLLVKGERFDYEMNVLLEVGTLGLTIVTEPIATIYQDNNEHSHFRPLQDSLLIYQRILRFALASGLSAVVDLAVFALICAFFGTTGTALLIATISSRVISGGVNFSLNRQLVFADGGPWGAAAKKYLLLFLVQMFLSWGGVWVLHLVIPVAVIAKIITDTGLFLASYSIQQRHIFITQRS